MYIEVKVSNETVNKRFLISNSEVSHSKESVKQFYHYRVYDLNHNKNKYLNSRNL
ncbi:hypothetical protein COE65_24895 [Bacillus sp. AFS051223]|uniref:protein NO VEIN domain-containing protein n=1 Tax=Bacillus sp. AFS051223 TaxID=2034280 RepID=UPI000BFBEFF2|nr:hypothetical protein COE65_24895 [Bacillus sp. AFS051223]